MRPLPWSHSALSDFINCPKAYYHKRVAKDVVDPPNEAGLWGDYVHKQFEAYLLAKGKVELPPELSKHQTYLDTLLDYDGEQLVEWKCAITTACEPCDFFAKNVWCRAILDYAVIKDERARIIDHKTGKRKLNSKQLKLSAILMFLHRPEVEVVQTGYYWMQEGTFDLSMFTRDELDDLWEVFLPDLRQYLTAAKEEVWTPRPSGLCYGWCPVTQCEFWKPKRRK
jgi:hypothetical protein